MYRKSRLPYSINKQNVPLGGRCKLGFTSPAIVPLHHRALWFQLLFPSYTATLEKSRDNDIQQSSLIQPSANNDGA